MIKVKPIAPNQTEVRFNNNLLFFSYETLVAARIDDLFYRTNSKYSVATSKHINQWLAGREAIGVQQEDLEKLANKD